MEREVILTLMISLHERMKPLKNKQWLIVFPKNEYHFMDELHVVFLVKTSVNMGKIWKISPVLIVISMDQNVKELV